MRVPRIQGPRRVAAADFAQACLQIGSKPKYSTKKKYLLHDVSHEVELL